MHTVLLIATIVLESTGMFRVTGWPEAAKLTPQQWQDMFSVQVDAADVPPLLGSYRIERDTLVFAPRYPLQRGLRYKASLKIPGQQPIVQLFDTPKADITPSTYVRHVYPSTNVLPENQLKFYIHFSSSMGRGEAYQRVHLLDDNGKLIELPFLELAEELWDQDATRFTLLFDPGRIKRGLIPHNENGAPIQEGKKYTLVIDREWRDADGKPLKESFQKSFSVGPADRKPLELKSWRIIPPVSGTSDPVTIEFPEPLDHALMERHLEVLDPYGNPLPGSIEIDRDEMRWRFNPITPWKNDGYAVRVGTVIADLAGNMVDRPFEVDVFEKVDQRLVRETRVIPFRIN